MGCWCCWVSEAVFDSGGFGRRKWLHFLSSSPAPWFLPSSLCRGGEDLFGLPSDLWPWGFLILRCAIPLKPSTTNYTGDQAPLEFLTKYWPKIAQCHNTCVNTTDAGALTITVNPWTCLFHIYTSYCMCTVCFLSRCWILGCAGLHASVSFGI